MLEQTSDYLARKLRENWLNRCPDLVKTGEDTDDSLTNLSWLQSLSLTNFTLTAGQNTPLRDPSPFPEIPSRTNQFSSGNHTEFNQINWTPIASTMTNITVESEKQYIDLYSTGPTHARPSVLLQPRRHRINKSSIPKYSTIQGGVKANKYFTPILGKSNREFFSPRKRYLIHTILQKSMSNRGSEVNLKSSMPVIYSLQHGDQTSGENICTTGNSLQLIPVYPLNPATESDAAVDAEFFDVSRDTMLPTIDQISQSMRDKYRSDGNLIPPFTQCAMIFMCMQQLKKHKVTLGDMKSWLVDNFACFRKHSPNLLEELHTFLSNNRCYQRVPRRKEEPDRRTELWRLNAELQSQLDKGRVSKFYLEHWNAKFPNLTSDTTSDSNTHENVNVLANPFTKETTVQDDVSNITAASVSIPTSNCFSDGTSLSNSTASPTLSDPQSFIQAFSEASDLLHSGMDSIKDCTQENSPLLCHTPDEHLDENLLEYLNLLNNSEGQDTLTLSDDQNDESSSQREFPIPRGDQSAAQDDWWNNELQDCLENIFSDESNSQELPLCPTVGENAVLEHSCHLRTPEMVLENGFFVTDAEKADVKGIGDFELLSSSYNKGMHGCIADFVSPSTIAEEATWIDEQWNFKDLDSILGLA